MTETSAPFNFEQEDKVSVLTLKPELNQVQWGEIDSIGTQVLNSMTSNSQPNIIVDLSHLNYMGSAMVALIVRVWKATLGKKGQLAVVCPHDGVKEVLRLASLDKHWKIVPTLDEARQLLGSGKAVAAVHVPASKEPKPNWLLLIGAPLGLLLIIAALTYAINPELIVGKKYPNLNRNDEAVNSAASKKENPATETPEVTPAAATSEFEELPAGVEKPVAAKPTDTTTNPHQSSEKSKPVAEPTIDAASETEPDSTEKSVPPESPAVDEQKSEPAAE